MSCSNLLTERDLVNSENIVSCISSLSGVRADSASPSDIYILKFKNGTVFQGESVDIGFQKVFISKAPGNISKSRRALKYELEVYRLIKILLINNVNGHFVKPLGGVKGGITFEQLIRYIQNFTNLTEKEAIYTLTRNTNIMYYEKKNRPSIDDKERIYLYRKDVSNFEYGFILSEGLKKIKYQKRTNLIDDIQSFWNFYKNIKNGEVMTLNDLISFYKKLENLKNESIKQGKLDEYLKSPINTMDNTVITIIFNMLFQCATACYSLFINGISHNDLHTGNVLVKKTEPTVYKYNLPNGEKYEVKSNFCSLLFDWDRAYANMLGENKFLDGSLSLYNQTNNVIEQRDFVKLLCYFYKILKNLDTKKFLIDCICKQKPVGKKFTVNGKNWSDINKIKKSSSDENDYVDFWIQVYTYNDNCFLQNNYIDTLPEEIFTETLYTLPEIIKNLSQKINKVYNNNLPVKEYYIKKINLEVKQEERDEPEEEEYDSEYDSEDDETETEEEPEDEEETEPEDEEETETEDEE